MNLGQPQTEARLSQVQEQLGDMEKASATLEQQAEQLEGRLIRVLPQMDTGESKPSPPEPTLCSLASDLREQVRSIRGTSTRLGEILKRLEL